MRVHVVDRWGLAPGGHAHSRPRRFLLHCAGKARACSKEGVKLANSFEAWRHLLHFGRSDVPAC